MSKLRSKHDEQEGLSALRGKHLPFPIMIGEAAKLVGVSPQHFRWFETKKITKPLLVGRKKTRFFLPDDIEAVKKFRAEQAAQEEARIKALSKKLRKRIILNTKRKKSGRA